MVHASFINKAMIHGFYRDIWSAVMSEKLTCEKEPGNLVTSGKNSCRIYFSAQFVCVQNMQKFAPLEIFPLYSSYLMYQLFRVVFDHRKKLQKH